MGKITQSPMKGNVNQESVKTPVNHEEKPAAAPVKDKQKESSNSQADGIFDGDSI